MLGRMSVPSSSPSRKSLWRKLANACIATIVGVVLALVSGELLLRLFLFQPSLELFGLGQGIRQPQKYADGDSDDDYWKLRSGFQDPETIVDAPNADPITGWTGSYVTAGTYAHVDEPTVRGRQLVLLYGDSFAQCNTPPNECFQAILEQSDLAQKYAMLNYGVGGYGFDQTYLLLAHSIDRFKALDPIVIVSVLVESDLDRSVLAFRDWPKPRLSCDGNRLVARGPVNTNARRFLAENRPRITSYLWRFFLFHPARFMRDVRTRWRTDERVAAEKIDLNRRILIEIDRELASRGLRHFLLVFHAEQGAIVPWDMFTREEQMLHDVCAELALPLVDTRPYLAFASDDNPVNAARLYGHAGSLEGHHDVAGNLVCFEAIRQGLSGRFDEPDFTHLSSLKRHGLFDSGAIHTETMTIVGRQASVIGHGAKERVRVAEQTDRDQLLLRADAGGSTRVVFELGSTMRRFRGAVHALKNPEGACAGVEIGFTVQVGDETVLERAVPSAADPVALDVDLNGKPSLSLIVEGVGGGAACEWVCIEKPRFE